MCVLVGLRASVSLMYVCLYASPVLSVFLCICVSVYVCWHVFGSDYKFPSLFLSAKRAREGCPREGVMLSKL